MVKAREEGSSEVNGGERSGFRSVERMDQGGERVERGRGGVPEQLDHGQLSL